MGALKVLYNEITGFLGIGPLLNMYKSGNYSSLLTFNGIISAIGPLIPFLLIIEIIRSLVYRKFKIDNYKVTFLTYVFNRFTSTFISIAATAFCIALLQKHAIIKTTFVWYW